jgi:signal transduction histidine kinase
MPFSAEERDLAIALAAHAATALANAETTQELLAEQEARLREREQAIAERVHLAQDIHRAISEHLRASLLVLEQAEKDPGSPEEPLPWFLRQIRTHTNEGMKDLRMAITVLKPPPSRLPLEEVLEEALARFARVGEFKAIFDAAPRPFPDLLLPAREALIRVAKDALANVVQHADAEKVELFLAIEAGTPPEPRQARLTIRDDGVGFRVETDEIGRFRPEDGMRGFGLESMHEQAQQAGGTLQIISAPGRGTEIDVRIPIRGDTHEKTESSVGG